MRLFKKVKREMTFFINPTTGKRQYNRQCRRCIHDCKQSYRAQLLVCPKYRERAGVAVELASADGDRS